MLLRPSRARLALTGDLAGPSPGSLLLPAADDADMPEPTLPTLPADETSPATVDLSYRTRLSAQDEATDVDPPLALYEETDEEEVDSVILPARHEEATAGEERLRAWRELSEERAIARKEEARILAVQRLERRRRAAMGAAVAGLLGVALVATSALEDETAPANSPAAALAEGPVFAAPAVAIVVAPNGEPLLEDPVVEPVAEVVAEPVVAPEPEPTPTAFDPGVVDGTLNTWTADNTAWLQFDFAGTEPLEIHWLDAANQEALNPWVCDGYLNKTTRRCYVGRTHERLQVALRGGAAPGTWTLTACQPGTALCAPITTIEVAAAL